MTWPRPAVIALAVSCLTLIATPMAVSGAGLDREPVPASVGDRHASAPAQVAATAAAPKVTPVTGSAPGISVQAVERAALAAYAPTSIWIPALDLRTQVVPVAQAADGSVAVPSDIGTVGWYALGVAPGSPVGSAVLVGHRDGRVDGHGAFYALAQLSPGNRIHITDASGADLGYTVVAREVLATSALPASDLFAVDGAPRLTLITCGGVYERANGGYQANVVITAVPDPR